MITSFKTDPSQFLNFDWCLKRLIELVIPGDSGSLTLPSGGKILLNKTPIGSKRLLMAKEPLEPPFWYLPSALLMCKIELARHAQFAFHELDLDVVVGYINLF